ncbi:hypothetical protein ELI24_33070 (plasmid) [Rhizobium ruizarguesonis]|uniref:RNA polymerase sigma54 factor n=2 Tax=Rhizobium leguminosarum TaxID=384 RepID=A0A1B8R8P2_RHILT|nr:RNA polymerase sigma54 factor [Rhizobium leguminosarum bv. trifolii]TAU13447.1 hypothetical protein ELI50_35760 [Rhizobium leguminosarum]TAU15609.1 hypothetical protein ELI48_31760 [Rhizobium ruizarguesonis]OBY05160.1 hypothetical protein BAE36_21500 [Rhizobium leguminosarum bv. trifolii]TAU37089.1 hypothetical protein ELI43_35255 [Rhizobium leguminosarum]
MTSSAKLSHRQTPPLVMTPELMQPIQLPQMARFELNQFITLEVEKNPLLEFPSNDSEAGGEYTPAGDEQFGHSPEDARADDGDDSRTDALSSGRYDNGGNASTSRLSDELDADYTISPD